MVSYLLHHADPGLFPEEPADDAWFRGSELDLLCFALRVHQEAFPLTENHEMENTITALSAVIDQQCRAIGASLAHSIVAVVFPRELLQGHFPVAGKNLT